MFGGVWDFLTGGRRIMEGVESVCQRYVIMGYESKLFCDIEDGVRGRAAFFHGIPGAHSDTVKGGWVSYKTFQGLSRHNRSVIW